MQKITAFDTSQHHIYVAAHLIDSENRRHAFRAVLDTGAPVSEFSDEFLFSIGLIGVSDLQKVNLSEKEQTKKYARMTLQQIECLGQEMRLPTVRVSKFAEGWGIDALIGLDFFRTFDVTVSFGTVKF